MIDDVLYNEFELFLAVNVEQITLILNEASVSHGVPRKSSIRPVSVAFFELPAPNVAILTETWFGRLTTRPLKMPCISWSDMWSEMWWWCSVARDDTGQNHAHDY